ncbi:MAG: ferrochelatase [Planctomycetaceae bacterium]
MARSIQLDLVYQSRSGRPQDPWLEPDILDHLKSLHDQGVDNVVVYPVGFLSDHMEVMFDLDIEAHDLCQELGMNMVRAATVGIHPTMIDCWVDVIKGRVTHQQNKKVIGCYAANRCCPENCCPNPCRARPQS